MNRKKVIISSSLIVGLCLLLAWYFWNAENRIKSDDENSSFQELSGDEIYEKLKDKENKSLKLHERHCLENLCINDISMKFVRSGGFINFKIQNVGNETIPEGFVKIVDKNDSSRYYYVFFNDIKGGSETFYQIQVENQVPFDLDDYNIVKLTPEELDRVKKSLNIS